jgi:transcriptional regulator with XRE-family HTH domain
MKYEALKKEALKRPEVRAAYDALGPEFELLQQMLAARAKAGLTQADVAERMGTHAPAITRLESALTTGRHSPSIETLKRYATAVGCELEIRLVARRPKSAGAARKKSVA